MPAVSTLRSRDVSVAHGLDKLWNDAVAKYEQETGHKLSFADDFPSNSRKPEEIIEYIARQSDLLKASRAVGQRIRRVLKPVVNVVLLFLDAGAEAGSNAAPGGKAIFGAMEVLLQATKGVSGLYDAVEALLQRVADFFEHAPDLLDVSAPPAPALTNILVKTLVQLFIALAIATKHCSMVAKTESRLKEVLRAVFRRTKDYFNILIGQADVADALRTLEGLAKKELLAIATQTYALTRDVQRKAGIERISSWLNPPKRLPNNYENKRRDGSCEWFFDDKFRKWKNQKDGMYWVSGTAGTGKSVLCSSVIDTLKEDDTLLLAYFYFDYSDTVKKDSGSSGLLSSLVFQIGTADDEGITYLKSKRTAHAPTPTMLLDLLSQLLRLSGRTFIIIDALDECPEPERVHRGLFGFLWRLRDLQRDDSVDLRVLIASRPEPDLRESMPQLATHLLTDFQGVPEHAAEIGRHIESQLFGKGSQSLYSSWSNDIKREAQAIMIKKSNGMFLWVDIVLRYLRRCDPGDVLNVLSELPADLYKTYERILSEFPPSRAMTARAVRVLECVAFAKRPLYLDEVMAVFSANLNSPNETVVDPTLVQAHIDGPDLETSILNICPSLLNLVDSADGRKVVQFIHFSAKEYLTSLELSRTASAVREYSLEEHTANLVFARLCIASLNLDDLLSGFQPYAAQFFEDHLSPPIADTLHSHSFRFPGSLSSEFFNSWARIHFRRDMQNASRSSELTHEIIRTRGMRQKTALHAAAQWGRAEVSLSLLAHGAIVDDADEDGNTPLHDAAYFGHTEVARILLEYPARDGTNVAALRCRIRDEQGRTALHKASRQGHVDVVRALLDHGSLINAADHDGNTSLHDAAAHGRSDVVRILLEHPAVNDLDTLAFRCRARGGAYGETALHRAASCGHTEVARTLLDHGALVND